MSSEKITGSSATQDRFNTADNPYTNSEFFKFVRIIGFLMIL